MVSDFRRLVSRLKLRHLELLQSLGEDPNVHRASARLNMSQPTASKLLREIELTVGQPLFVRNRRGLEPTPVGRVMSALRAIVARRFGAASAQAAGASAAIP